MTKQVLDVRQMQHLQELGLELKETMMYWTNNHKEKQNWYMTRNPVGRLFADECLPAYTLQDVLDVLPEYIYDSTEQYLLEINFFYKYIRYSRFNDVLTKRDFDRTPIIDAAYELLCWAIENKFVETNKNE